MSVGCLRVLGVCVCRVSTCMCACVYVCCVCWVCAGCLRVCVLLGGYCACDYDSRCPQKPEAQDPLDLQLCVLSSPAPNDFYILCCIIVGIVRCVRHASLPSIFTKKKSKLVCLNICKVSYGCLWKSLLQKGMILLRRQRQRRIGISRIFSVSNWP